MTQAMKYFSSDWLLVKEIELFAAVTYNKHGKILNATACF